MSVNREYKSSVFTTLFSDPEVLLSLYNALSGSSFPLDTPILMATLEDVLFTNRRNDIAFVVGDKVVILFEHQASINENMPLRLLLYVARVYEKLIDNDAVYKKKLLKIPRPDFIVLYNGAAPYPDVVTLKLSDAYTEIPENLLKLSGLLELEVCVVNINEGRNMDMVSRCEELEEYTKFVGKVRENVDAGTALDSAVTNAVKDCMDSGILRDFLATHSSEVINMLTTEWDSERERAVVAEEGREEGLDLSTEIIRALLKKEAINDIAARYNVSVEKVEQLNSVLVGISA